MSFLPIPAARVAIVDSRPSDYDNVLLAAEDANVSVHFMRSSSEAARFFARWQQPMGDQHPTSDLDGFDLAQMLRGMRPNSLIFIIGEEYRLDDEMQTLTLGLTKYVCKPLEPSWVIPQGNDSCIPLRVFQDVPATREADDEAIDILPSGLAEEVEVGELRIAPGLADEEDEIHSGRIRRADDSQVRSAVPPATRREHRHDG